MLVIVALCLILTTKASFDWALGNTSVTLSANTYCDVNTYMTRQWNGYSKGFVPLAPIYESKYDTHGFMGVMESQKAIYVVFRGSSSIRNWIDNIGVIKTDYPYCSKCEVHNGFYKTEREAFPRIWNDLLLILNQYPTYTVIVSGHSLGAAIATLVTMDLMDLHGLTNIKMINFGSPRVGNDEFAAYVSQRIVNKSRVTHHKDIVPHCPMHERFTHISGEYYEDDSGLKECSGYEDSKCSYQWHITNVDDHLEYLKFHMGCDS